jgi:MerR family transcriptional regulator, mercuric resistance operon regulatory protein
MVPCTVTFGYSATRTHYRFKGKTITTMRGLTIGRLAEAAHVNLETIRYYERIGLMPPPSRTSGGHRSYGHEHTHRLTFIRRARELGFTIEEIRALLALAAPGHASCIEVKAIAASHLERVRAKMTDLIKLEGILADTINRCSGERSPACPVLDMLDADPDWDAGKSPLAPRSEERKRNSR